MQSLSSIWVPIVVLAVLAASLYYILEAQGGIENLPQLLRAGISAFK